MRKTGTESDACPGFAYPFNYKNGSLFCEDADLTSLAETHGTPAYVYSKNTIVSRFEAYRSSFDGLPTRICFAVKANSNLAVLATLGRLGAGFDIVSAGELHRVLAAGGDPGTVVFSGVGKTAAEIRFALEKGIRGFNCESEHEIETISQIAVSLNRTASIAIRVNPDVNAITHPYISTGLREHKFGIDIAAAEAVYQRAAKLPGIVLEGVSCHIGSQLLDIGPLLEASEKVSELVRRLRSAGLPIRDLDLGGGLGVAYRPDERAACIQNLAEHLRPKLQGLGLTLLLEPGRSIVAEAGILLTRVLLTKRNGTKLFVIVDGAMNDLIRPALYQAHHEFLPLRQALDSRTITADIVGPICETGDFFARGREIPPVAAGDILAICTTGAYGFVLSSNYNSRPRACELLVDGARVLIARKRETFDDLVRGESSLV
jgi:diaminopimelate decarboxylase